MKTKLEVHPDLQKVLTAEGIKSENISNHYSDVYIECNNMGQAYRVRDAGAWKSMATVFTSNITGKPSVDIPFGCLDWAIKNK